MYYILCKQIYVYTKKKTSDIGEKYRETTFLARYVVFIYYTYTSALNKKRGKNRKRSFLDNIKAYIYIQGANANGGEGGKRQPINFYYTHNRPFVRMLRRRALLSSRRCYICIFTYIYNIH